MELAHLTLEYIKVLIWPITIISVLVKYREAIGGLLLKSKVRLSLFGVEIETKISDLERMLTADGEGTLTNQQWALLEKIANQGPISIAKEGYQMNMEADLRWIRPVRNAGLLISLPDGNYIEQAEEIDLTPLGKLLIEAKLAEKSAAAELASRRLTPRV